MNKYLVLGWRIVRSRSHKTKALSAREPLDRSSNLGHWGGRERQGVVRRGWSVRTTAWDVADVVSKSFAGRVGCGGNEKSLFFDFSTDLATSATAPLHVAEAGRDSFCGRDRVLVIVSLIENSERGAPRASTMTD